ncbi:MAG: hypothetical protein KKA79_08890 [Nanoarchaeota archaeon]|nr:hypothetical protein [Nanoarchaeota archaeon]MCG2717662.1 hypothetical protein [Nanoarchaeota archaeon]
MKFPQTFRPEKNLEDRTQNLMEEANLVINNSTENQYKEKDEQFANTSNIIDGSIKFAGRIFKGAGLITLGATALEYFGIYDCGMLESGKESYVNAGLAIPENIENTYYYTMALGCGIFYGIGEVMTRAVKKQWKPYLTLKDSLKKQKYFISNSIQGRKNKIINSIKSRSRH